MSTSTRDLSSGELWQHSLERSRRRRVLAEDAKKTITRKKQASLAVTAAMAATPVAPSLIASASSGPGRGTLSATQIRHENSDRVLLKIQHCSRFDGFGVLQWAAARLGIGTAIAGGNIAEDRAARPREQAPNRWPQLARQKDWETSSAKSASSCPRCSPQARTTSTPAPRRAARGASKTTRRHGTWLLTRTQLTSF